MSNKKNVKSVKIDKNKFIQALHDRGISIKSLDDPNNELGIDRTEKTIRRYLDNGEMPIDLLNNICNYAGLNFSDFCSNGVTMLVLTSYYGDVDYDVLEKLVGNKDDSDILVDLVDDGPDWRFQDDEMQEAVEIIERLKNSTDGLTIQGPDVKYVFRLVEIPDDYDDVVFDCDYGEDWREEYLYYCKDGKIKRVNGFYKDL